MPHLCTAEHNLTMPLLNKTILFATTPLPDNTEHHRTVALPYHSSHLHYRIWLCHYKTSRYGTGPYLTCTSPHQTILCRYAAISSSTTAIRSGTIPYSTITRPYLTVTVLNVTALNTAIALRNKNTLCDYSFFYNKTTTIRHFVSVSMTFSTQRNKIP